MPLTPLGERQKLRRYLLTEVEDFDIATLATLTTDAWAHDYVDQLRINLDAHHLQHMLSGDDWFAIVVCDERDTPVGFEIAMGRTVYCRGDVFTGYYVSAFTVASTHRRRGIGQWVLEGINEVAFEGRGADLLFSAFHRGMAGSPTVQSTFDKMADFGVTRFHRSANYGVRVDRDPPPDVAMPLSVTRVTSTGDGWQHHVESEAAGPIDIPSLSAFDAHIRDHYDVGFALDKSFHGHYLSAEQDDGVMLWFGFDNGAKACVSYAITPLIVNDRVLKPSGMIQAVSQQGCSNDQLEQMMLALAHHFRELGCLAISLYDLGVIPMSVIDNLGLNADDEFDYAVRGPRAVIEQFEGVQSPFYVDLT